MRGQGMKMKDKAIDLLNGIITDQTTKAELDIIKYLKRLVKADLGVKTQNENNITEKEAEEFFNKTYDIYPRKISKVKARSVYMKKILGLPKEKAREKAEKAMAAYNKLLAEAADVE
jgi:uncharacterized HAD superfamily protein